MYYALGCLNSTLSYITIIVFFNAYLQPRGCHRNTLLLGFVLYNAFFVVMDSQSNHSAPQTIWINTVIVAAIHLIIALVFCDDTVLKKAVFVLLFHSVGAASDLLVGMVLIIANQLTVSGLYGILSAVGNTISKLLALSLIILLKRIFKERHFCNDKKSLLWTATYPFLSTMMMIIYFVAVNDVLFSVHLQIMTFSVLVALLISSVITFFLYDATMRSIELEAERSIKAKTQEAHEQHYIDLEHSLDEKSTALHNHKNKLIGLSALITEPEAQAYCRELIDEHTMQLSYYKFDFSNRVLDMLLGRLKANCDDHKIQFQIDVQYRDFSFLNCVHTSVLFGCLFDNALESCNRMAGERWIHIQIKQKDHFVCFLLKNSMGSPTVSDGESLLSSKREFSQPGHGIRSIKQLSTHYGGHYHFLQSDQEFISTVWLIPQRK